jgi:hypothetical protein
LLDKFRKALGGYMLRVQANEIIHVCERKERMFEMPVPEFMDLFAFEHHS